VRSDTSFIAFPHLFYLKMASFGGPSRTSFFSTTPLPTSPAYSHLRRVDSPVCR